MPPGVTLAAATEGFPEVVMAASQEAALPEVASRVEADMVVGGIKRRIVFDKVGKVDASCRCHFLGQACCPEPACRAADGRVD